MKVYVCFRVYRSKKCLCLIFLDKEKAESFIEKNTDCILEQWEVIR